VLVDRGARRVTDTSGTVSYELHGNGWRFHPGHKVRIEIAQDDGPYLKASNVASTATITGVTLQIPTVENAGYVRPKGATPLVASLAIAYKSCTSPNRRHGSPLAFGSCNPPQQASDQLTVGTPDANGQSSNSVGSVRYKALTGDVQIAVSLTDVRKKSDLSDYTGELQADQTLRITDTQNGPSQDEPGTVVDTEFPVTVPCAASASTTTGSTCAVTTTANTLVPGAVSAGKRAVWELGQVKVFDGGPDGLASTQPNTLFADQGVFVP
jgi:hypothetical protein